MIGARTALRFVLVLQIGLAVALAAADLSRGAAPGSLPGALPFSLPGLRAPSLDAPVAPGDQTRRFAPSDLRDLPAAGDMPSRLLFEREGDAIRLTGQIAPGDGARFDEWFEAQAGGAEVAQLHSTGGSVQDALAIGRALRAAALNTEVAANRLCLSACPYIFAGGIARRVGAGAALGVHQHFHGENVYLPAFLAIEDIQSGQAEVLAHLVGMGVDPRMMIPAMSTPPAEIYVLLPDELEDYRLVTEANVR
ncbi:MAG: hypothetical protein AAGJ91_03880 [Pseudomonadota bacterium]